VDSYAEATALKNNQSSTLYIHYNLFLRLMEEREGHMDAILFEHRLTFTQAISIDEHFARHHQAWLLCTRFISYLING